MDLTKNTATVTWMSWNNYGSLLQAYALQHTLKLLGYDNHIISDERIDMFAEADYTEGSTAYMWIVNKIKEYAGRIIQVERNRRAVVSEGPHHLV